MPTGAVSLSLTMTTAGPASPVEIFAIKEMRVTSMLKPGTGSRVLLSDSGFLAGPKGAWTKSGTHR